MLLTPFVDMPPTCIEALLHLNPVSAQQPKAEGTSGLWSVRRGLMGFAREHSVAGSLPFQILYPKVVFLSFHCDP
jgi:hypothetical protein